MSVERFSFLETPNWRDYIGFTVRIGLSFRPSDNNIIIEKGSLVYGFKEDENTPAYGYVVDTDEVIPVLELNQTNYIGMNKNGNFVVVPETMGNVRGIGAQFPNIPWYTFQNGAFALVGKVFIICGIITGFITCDDPYWCEFEPPEYTETL